MNAIEKEEQKNWEQIKQQMLTQQKQLTGSLNSATEELQQFQTYLVNYKGEIDPHEMFTNVRLQEQQILASSIKFQQLEKLQKQLSNPYFTRVDFLFDGETKADALYIGRFSFSNEQNQLLIYDWRAPIASLFYDFDFGAAYYEAPNGLVKGAITGKRQLKFVAGELNYVLDTHTTIFDDILQKELSNQQSGRMSTIISTIQKEQSQIIRSTNHKDLIVHGVAGSGKTSIALHRIAFLLYQERERLSSDQITILSPNRVFGSYISEVLPELGEEPVNEWSIDLLMEQLTKQKATISRLEETELAIADQLPAQISYLATSKSVKDLQNFLYKMEQTIFEAELLEVGSYEFPPDYLNRRFQAYRRQPIVIRLEMIANDIIEEVKNKPFRPKRLPTKNQLKKKLIQCLNYRSSAAIYDAFLSDQDIQPLKSYCYSDLFPLAHIQSFFDQTLTFEENKYVVIDEIQDYTMMQLRVIKDLFPCQKLLVGDYTQQITVTNFMNLSQLQQIFSDANLVQLTKSYRSTFEIMNFAKGLIQDQLIEPVIRHGADPVVLQIEDSNRLAVIKKQVRMLTSNFQTIALITKNTHQAQNWYDRLKDSISITLLQDNNQTLDKVGIYLCGVGTAKGLEFDAVIVLDSQVDNFAGRAGHQQLFVAATRAIHQLILIEGGAS
ncbi:HelD family protein [Enterococcus sp. AZ163]|uniref:HelD family protein n=1 Tax=Enterococcus sp. AZ163 TaxID=2774638 RepID=UPI003D2B5C6E